MGHREFRWLPYAGKRHAIPDWLVARDQGATLCGVEVTVPAIPPPKVPDGCWPTCTTCDAAWREHEGLPLFRGAAVMANGAGTDGTAGREGGDRDGGAKRHRGVRRAS